MSLPEPKRSPSRRELSDEATERADPELLEADDSGEGEEEQRQARAPWHFKVLAVGTVIYLGYRAFQGIEWLIHHL